MTVKIEGINRVFWNLAKREETTDLPLIKQRIVEYLGHGTVEQHSDYACFELAVRCVGDAVDKGLIRSHMFCDAMLFWNMHPAYQAIFKNQADDRPELLKIIHMLLSMIRYVQVRDDDNILVDFGQYDSVHDSE